MSTDFVQAEPSLPAQPFPSNRAQTVSPRGLTVREKRFLAKAGLVASLSIVTLTGFHKGSRSMGVHLASGLVLIALSLWHARLYKRPVRRVAATPRPQTQPLETLPRQALQEAA